jgi:WD40 repeat protein
MTDKLIDQFSQWLDQLLGLAAGQASVPVAMPEVQDIHQVAVALHEMDFEAELSPRAELRSRWESHAQNLNARNPPSRRLLNARIPCVAALLLALALLVAFRQPVLAAVSRLFGYIYIQDSGFLPADSTLVLQQPVMQAHNGLSLTVTRGVSRPNGTSLYIEYSDTVSPADGAFLEIAGGAQLALSYWEYSPNSPGSHGIKLGFPALPAGITQTTLVMHAGWHLPLTWIPAAQSQLPDVRAVPYIDATQQTSPVADLCVEKHGIRLCLRAATTGSENTSVLMDATPTNPVLSSSSWLQGLVWTSRSEPVTLRDEQGNIYPLDIRRPPLDGTLFFPPLGGTHTLTLTIPALYATVDISDQVITVDMGTDPQPGTIIPLDANIHVLGATVHFSKATFVGDGVSSLRLTLNADEPIQTVDGITPDQLELGRPDRVDDLYGNGDFGGSKDIFVELIRGSGKITGVLNLPVISATVIVQGPFEFTFTLSDTSATTPTPLVADPNAFSPALTPTPLSLDSYSYSRRTLESGDLLYTVLDGDKTNMYAYTPGAGSQPSLVAILPGEVSQIYIHPDHQGMDYLAGIQVTRDGTTYIDSMSLYTLNFEEAGPRLLYTFSANAGGMVGTAVSGEWSYDGRFVIIQSPQTTPGSGDWKFFWFDLSCRTGANCEPHKIVVPPSFSLSYPTFAPNDYRILFSGLDTSIGGIQGIFLLNFDRQQPDRQVVKIPSNMSIADIVAQPAAWTPDGFIFTGCWDATPHETDFFCKIDPATGTATHGEPVSPNLDGYRLFGFAYWLSPSGNQLLYLLFPINATDVSIPDLRFLDQDGHLGAIVASSFSISNVMFSPSGQSIAYMLDDEQRVEIYDIPTGSHTNIFDGDVPSALSGMGWVP